MVNLPNMMPEIIEAVHLLHEDNPDVELDCMLFLKRLVADDPKMLSGVIEWFEENDRCDVCGSRLLRHTYTVEHSELNGCAMPTEYITETICPQCEWGVEIDESTET